MKHIRRISGSKPVEAQYESILQLVGLAQAILALFTNVMDTFGIPIPRKQSSTAS